MSSYNYHQQCHYNDLISFIDDLTIEYGQSAIKNILENHDQLSADLLDYQLDFMENTDYEN